MQWCIMAKLWYLSCIHYYNINNNFDHISGQNGWKIRYYYQVLARWKAVVLNWTKNCLNVHALMPCKRLVRVWRPRSINLLLSSSLRVTAHRGCCHDPLWCLSSEASSEYLYMVLIKYLDWIVWILFTFGRFRFLSEQVYNIIAERCCKSSYCNR